MSRISPASSTDLTQPEGLSRLHLEVALALRDRESQHFFNHSDCEHAESTCEHQLYNVDSDAFEL